MLGMVISLSLLAVGARELSDRHGPFELLVARHSIALMILLPFVKLSKFNLDRTQHFILHLFRNISHLAATAGWFIAIGLLPLAEVFAIEFTTPIWVAVFATLFLREKINRGRVIALILGMVGVLVILRPGFNVIGLGSVIMLASAVGFAVTNTCTKALTRYDNLITVLFWMSLIQLPISFIPAVFKWTPLMWNEIPWILVIGISGLLGHLSLTRALQLADATLVNPVDFLRLPLIALVGYLVYSEKVDIYVAIGALLIFSGNYYAIWREK